MQYWNSLERVQARHKRHRQNSSGFILKAQHINMLKEIILPQASKDL